MIKKRFLKTCLKVLLIITLLVVILYSIDKWGFNDRDTLTKESLEKNEIQLVEYTNNRSWEKIWRNFAKPETRSRSSIEKLIESGEKSRGKYYTKIIEIHTSKIDNNFGYLDVTTTSCFDEECDQKKIKRIFHKWLFVENKWYPKGTTECTRDAPYDISPEFERALSLIKQRSEQKNLSFTDYEENTYDTFYNCLNIQYANLRNKGAEGVFYFDPIISNIEDLRIDVDTSYQLKDDILTAILLMHEITHAIQFIYSYTYNENITCIEKEVMAFKNELTFLNALNKEEYNSITSRIINSVFVKYNPNLSSIMQLIVGIGSKAKSFCNNNENSDNCYWIKADELIRNMVNDNPYYQKQCNL